MKVEKFESGIHGFIVGPLTTTLWGQLKPYNYCMEPVGASSTAMGCVGIGGAQLMRYHSYPPHAKGTLPAYDKYDEMEIDGYEYQWDLMPDKLSNDSSIESKKTTSNLIYHAAFSATSNFGPGTPGHPNDLLKALVDNFKYDKNVSMIDVYSELGYSLKEIEDLVREDLDLHRPVMVTIPGHFIVCDGYDDKGTFSFNYGWEFPQYVMSLGPDGAEAQKLYMGLRPAQLEILRTKLLNIDNIMGYPGDKAHIKASIVAIDNDFNGFVRSALIDANNVRRSYISPAYPIELTAGNSLDISLAIEIPPDASYGERKINLMYSRDGKDYRALRNDNEEIISHSIEVKKITSTEVFFSSTINLPEMVNSNESVHVTLILESSELNNKYINCYLTDRFGNLLYKVGEGHAQISSKDYIQKLEIDLDLGAVKTEEKYFMAFTESISKETEYYSEKKIKYSSGEELLHEIYIKNPSVNYSDVIYLAKEIDTSRVFYDQSVFSVPVTVDIRTENITPYYSLVATITNEADDIYHSSYYDIQKFQPGIHDVSFEFNINGVASDEKLFLNIMHYNGFEKGNDYLTPANQSISNPIPFILTHRDFYDYLFLASSLKSDSELLETGEVFEINSSVFFDVVDPFGSVVTFDLNAMLRSNTGEILEIGTLELLIVQLGQKTSFNLECKIPDSLLPGDYELYIKATNMGPSVNYSPNEMVNGMDNSIADMLQIEIIG